MFRSVLFIIEFSHKFAKDEYRWGRLTCSDSLLEKVSRNARDKIGPTKSSRIGSTGSIGVVGESCRSDPAIPRPQFADEAFQLANSFSVQHQTSVARCSIRKDTGRWWHAMLVTVNASQSCQFSSESGNCCPDREWHPSPISFGSIQGAKGLANDCEKPSSFAVIKSLLRMMAVEDK